MFFSIDSVSERATFYRYFDRVFIDKYICGFFDGVFVEETYLFVVFVWGVRTFQDSVGICPVAIGKWKRLTKEKIE